jgi:hypothetical protein
MRSKKYLWIVYPFLLWALLIGGCASMQKVSNQICNPTAEEKATADAMLAAINAAQAAAGMFLPQANIIQASTVLNTIRAGGCFLIAELADAFKVVDAANVSVQPKTKSLGAAKAPVLLPEYPALRKFVR